MGILSGNPQQEPLHCGEVFDIYNALSVAQAGVASCQIFINNTGDEDLGNFLRDKVDNLLRPQIDQLSEILKVNGIVLPPAPPERPNTDLENIPPGARINDAEIAVAVAKDISLGLVACSQAMGKAFREDIAMMFGKFHMESAQYGLKLLRMMKKKNWLVPQPLYANTMVETN